MSWIVMVLCYVVTTSMVGFLFGMVGLALGWNTRNQRPLLNFITLPILLVTTYFCFRFLVKELAGKAVEEALDKVENAPSTPAELSSAPTGKPDEAGAGTQEMGSAKS